MNTSTQNKEETAEILWKHNVEGGLDNQGRIFRARELGEVSDLSTSESITEILRATRNMNLWRVKIVHVLKGRVK